MASSSQQALFPTWRRACCESPFRLLMEEMRLHKGLFVVLMGMSALVVNALLVFAVLLLDSWIQQLFSLTFLDMYTLVGLGISVLMAVVGWWVAIPVIFLPHVKAIRPVCVSITLIFLLLPVAWLWEDCVGLLAYVMLHALAQWYVMRGVLYLSVEKKSGGNIP